jgi:hypothetical protein
MKTQMDMSNFNYYTCIYLRNVECCARVLEAIVTMLLQKLHMTLFPNFVDFFLPC